MPRTDLPPDQMEHGQLVAEVLKLRDGRDTMLALIRDLASDELCWFDHHGGCQAHGYLSLRPGELCPHAEAHQLLAQESEAKDA